MTAKLNIEGKFGSNRLHALMALAALVVSLPGFAMTAQNLPPEHRAGTVSYLSGGVGEDEAAALKQAAAGYPLEVELLRHTADGGNEYLAGNRVVIRDARGATVLETTSEGPFLLARLAPGRYTVSAQQDGISKSRAVRIAPSAHQRIVFDW